jgi:uncharacterized Zn-binding protein involved in type VI secretion
MRFHVLALPDSLTNSPETVGHQHSGSEEVHSGAEAANGEVALVLYGAVAARRRHILRHGGQLVRGLNGCSKRIGNAET